MITKPSLMMNDTEFCVAGVVLPWSLGKAEMMGDLSFNDNEILFAGVKSV